MFLYGEQIDRRLNWSLGRTERLARRGNLPHVVLPDGSIRFEWEQIERLIKVVPAKATEQREKVEEAQTK